MAFLQIRDMPPDVYEATATRPEAKNLSMAQQAVVERRLPDLAVREA